jgi:hypothetical protein
MDLSTLHLRLHPVRRKAANATLRGAASFVTFPLSAFAVAHGYCRYGLTHRSD